MSSKKRRARNMSQSEAQREVETLKKCVQELTTANLLLTSQRKTYQSIAEHHRQGAVRREVDNEYLEARNRNLRQENNTLRTDLDKAAYAQRQAEKRADDLATELQIERERAVYWQNKWNALWAAFERTVKRLGRLQSVASDVYDLCFEDDRQKEVRHLRRVLKVLGAFITREVEVTH